MQILFVIRVIFCYNAAVIMRLMCDAYECPREGSPKHDVMATMISDVPCFPMVCVSCARASISNHHNSEVILGMGSANEGRRHYVAPPLIGLAHSQNDPCGYISLMGILNMGTTYKLVPHQETLSGIYWEVAPFFVVGWWCSFHRGNDVIVLQLTSSRLIPSSHQRLRGWPRGSVPLTT